MVSDGVRWWQIVPGGVRGPTLLSDRTRNGKEGDGDVASCTMKQS